MKSHSVAFLSVDGHNTIRDYGTMGARSLEILDCELARQILLPRDLTI
jgi:hypothetical protein